MLRRTACACALLITLFSAVPAHAAGFTTDDTFAAIAQASATYGLSYDWLYATVGCETGWTFNPYTVGDHGTSFGPAQLHRGGLLAVYYADGYTDVYDPYQALDFLGAEFARGGSHYWSCA